MKSLTRMITAGVTSAGALAAVMISAAPALADTQTFTSGCTTWTVPSGVTSVAIQASGSAGQTGGSAGGTGGSGDVVSGTLSALTAGQTLYVCAGWPRR